MTKEMAESLKQERLTLLKNAARQTGKLDRVPHLGNLWTWKIQDAGYKMSEAMFDYDIMLDVHRKCYEKYLLDTYIDLGCRNPLKVVAPVGNTEYIIDDEKNSLNVLDQCMMQADEYDALIENPIKFLWETALPRKNKIWKDGEKNAQGFRSMLRELDDFNAYSEAVNRLGEEEYGIPRISDSSCYVRGTAWGFEYLFNQLRGIRGLSLDIRRQSSKVEAAVETLNALYFDPILENYSMDKAGSTPNAAFDGLPSMLGHTILNPRQFEKFYWPFLSRMGAFAEKYDKIFYIFCEGDVLPFYEFFQQLPKGHFVLHCEQTDIFEMRKKAPNIALSGGMPCSLLANGTPEECIEYAKKLIDEMAGRGGFIFSEDKMISFARECRAENYQAVCEFVYNYRG